MLNTVIFAGAVTVISVFNLNGISGKGKTLNMDAETIAMEDRVTPEMLDLFAGIPMEVE